MYGPAVSQRYDPAWLDGDAAARLAAAERADIDDSAAEQARGAAARTSLADRWRSAAGRTVTVQLAGGHQLQGFVAETGSDWAWLRAPEPAVVRLGAVVTVEGAGHGADPGGPTAQRLPAGYALRRLAALGHPVRLLLVEGGFVEGTLVLVLADGLDVVRHPRDRSARPDDPVTTVAWAAVAAAVAAD